MIFRNLMAVPVGLHNHLHQPCLSPLLPPNHPPPACSPPIFSATTSHTPGSSTSDNGTPGTSRKQVKKRERACDDIRQRLEALDQRREKRERREDSEESHFANTMTDMLRRLPPPLRSQAQFRIHELLFNMEQEYLYHQQQPSSHSYQSL